MSKIKKRVCTGRKWNEEFQTLIDELHKNKDDEVSMISIVGQLRNLNEEFATVAKQLGTIIIQERYKDNSEKIFPATDTLGGVAGGEKYLDIEEGILFKFCCDKLNLYAGDEYIMKTAGHELKSIMEFIGCTVAGLYFPLTVLVDYCGFRLIAMSILPIDKETLCYGSCDGGNTIHSTNANLSARIKLAAQEILNLQEHYVWNLSETTKTKLHGPVDMEGHLGRDGRFYLLDLARLFPPQTPVKGVKGSFLYNLLRPELVKQNPTPLCSDAFSFWKVENHQVFQADVMQATERIHKEAIPKFIDIFRAFCYKSKSIITEEHTLHSFLPSLKALLHQHGINMRFMGAVRALMISNPCSDQDPLVCRLLLTEIASRTARKILWGRLRNVNSLEETQLKIAVIKFVNSVFSHNEEADLFWKDNFKKSLLKRFSNSLTRNEYHLEFDLRDRVDLNVLNKRLQNFGGFTLSENANENIAKSIVDKDYNLPLLKFHDIQFNTQVKCMHQIDFAEGTCLSQKAAKVETNQDADKLFEEANVKFESALQRKPDDYKTLHNWGLAIMNQAARKNETDAPPLYQKAAEKYEAALNLNPKDHNGLFLMGNLKVQQAQVAREIDLKISLLKEAETFYERSLANNTDSDHHYNWVNFYYNWGNCMLYQAKLIDVTEEDHRKSLDKAIAMYGKAVEKNPKFLKCLVNLATALSRRARVPGCPEHLANNLFEKAEQMYQTCLTMCSTDGRVFYSLGNTYTYHAEYYTKPFLNHLNNKTQNGNDKSNENIGVSKETVWKCINLLSNAGRFYLTALEHNPRLIEALTAWAKVILHQVQISGYCIRSFIDKAIDLINFSAKMCFALYRSIAMEDGSDIDLKPLYSLVRQQDNLEVSKMAFQEIEFLSLNSKNKELQKMASRICTVLCEKGLATSNITETIPGNKSSAGSYINLLRHLESPSKQRIKGVVQRPFFDEFTFLATTRKSDGLKEIHAILRGSYDELYVIKVRKVKDLLAPMLGLYKGGRNRMRKMRKQDKLHDILQKSNDTIPVRRRVNATDQTLSSMSDSVARTNSHTTAPSKGETVSLTPARRMLSPKDQELVKRATSPKEPIPPTKKASSSALLPGIVASNPPDSLTQDVAGNDTPSRRRLVQMKREKVEDAQDFKSAAFELFSDLLRHSSDAKLNYGDSSAVLAAKINLTRSTPTVVSGRRSITKQSCGIERSRLEEEHSDDFVLPRRKIPPPDVKSHENSSEGGDYHPSHEVSEVLEKINSLPFLVDILFTYQKDEEVYLVQQSIPEDRKLYSLRLNSGGTPNEPFLETNEKTDSTEQVGVRRLKSQTMEKQTEVRQKTFQRKDSKQSSSMDSLPLLHNQQKKYLHVFGEDIVKTYAAEILVAFQWLHRVGFTYRNLLLSNTYLDEKKNILLTQCEFEPIGAPCSPPSKFAVIKNLLWDHANRDYLYKVFYAQPPEVLRGEGYTDKSDMWSLGIFIHSMLTGSMEVMEVTAENLLKLPSNISAAAASAIENLLDPNPETRPSAIKMKKHPFFSDISWSDLGDTTTIVNTLSIAEKNCVITSTNSMVSPMEAGEFHWFTLIQPTRTALEDDSFEVSANFGIVPVADATTINQKKPAPYPLNISHGYDDSY